MSFNKFQLSSSILNVITQQGYKTPTDIQTKVIPLVLEKKDLVVLSQTGSGKSASFILPLLQLWSTKRDSAKKGKIKVLVLTPTRELTLQIAQGFNDFSKEMSKKPQVVSFIGGESIGDQLYNVQQGCDILVATSGRFLDILSKKQMNLSFVEFLVLDEADKMLDLVFLEELDSVLEAIPKNRQNLMFSATYPPKMKMIASKITQNAVEVRLEEEKAIVETISQRVIEVNRENRGPLLRELLKYKKDVRVLVFMANKRATDNIAEKFRKYGFSAASFNADLEQDVRNDTLMAFKEKKVHILFATDIAARGLDIDNIDCVINYDLPRSPADYIHRIGRTARAGKSGEAISFIDYETMEHFKLIEKRSSIKLKREQVKGFELLGEAPKKQKGPAPVKGKKKSKKDKLREKNKLNTND
ncbi:MAG TPA: DEAD/DEAH box helicase [Sulfurimonas sp.]|nr:DEAD/DEAH box helicase [Sulfurimonas sp.]